LVVWLVYKAALFVCVPEPEGSSAWPGGPVSLAQMQQVNMDIGDISKGIRHEIRGKWER
jgi:hypothetical protein